MSSVVYIEAAEQYFNPPQITVKTGTTVVWKDVQGTHDMVADDGSFASAILIEGGTYSHLFTEPVSLRLVSSEATEYAVLTTLRPEGANA